MTDRRSRPRAVDDRAMFWEHSVAFLKWSIALILVASVAFLIALFFVAPEQMPTARGRGPLVLLLVAATAWVEAIASGNRGRMSKRQIFMFALFNAPRAVKAIQTWP